MRGWIGFPTILLARQVHEFYRMDRGIKLYNGFKLLFLFSKNVVILNNGISLRTQVSCLHLSYSFRYMYVITLSCFLFRHEPLKNFGS